MGADRVRITRILRRRIGDCKILSCYFRYCFYRGDSMERNHLVNIGVQRFDRIREQKAFYIDKTDLIREWWDNGTDVMLITRPRRFGKTLNMSMLECFFKQI